MSEIEKLRDYAREASKALSALSGGGSEMFTKLGDEYYADPKLSLERARHMQETVQRCITRSQSERVSRLFVFAHAERADFARIIREQTGCNQGTADMTVHFLTTGETMRSALARSALNQSDGGGNG